MITSAEQATSILRGNLEALKPGAKRALEAPGAEHALRVDVSADGASAALVTRDGRRVPIHPSADPVATADALLAHLAQKGDAPLLIVIGLGLGYLLDALERRGGHVKVLAIEPIPAIARAMLGRRDWRDWIRSGRLTLVVGPDYVDAAEAWRSIPKGSPSPPVVVTPLMERECPSETARAKTIARQIVGGAESNEMARKAFAGRYLLNTLANVPVIASEGDAAALAAAFTGVPAVVVGAGPSVDLNLEHLRRVRQRALIIAVDTAVRPLLAGGVRPHVVVGVDPSEHNARHLDALPDTRGMWFVAEGSLDPRVFRQFMKRSFTFRVSNHHPWPWLASVGVDRGKLQAWGSVLTTAFDLACVAGCDPIVFAGADLAYTDGLLYCRNTVYEQEWAHLATNEERARVFAEGYFKSRKTEMQADVGGQQVLTAPQFIQFRNWLVARADGATGQRIVNATGRGILHGGRIAQAELGSVVSALGEPREGLAARLQAAWTASSGPRREAQVAVERVLRQKSVLPIKEWLEFGGDTASAAQIDGALDSASVGLSASVRKAAYMAMQRDYYEQRAQSPDAARRLVHPDYEVARLQANAQQAHVLLEYALRNYPLEAAPSAVATAVSASALPRDVRALDIGCGIGRAMEPLVDAGLRVDGVDISERMIAFARENPKLASSQFFVSRGNDCGDAADGAYDLAYSQMCFQHLCSRSIRNDLLQAIARALRPGGVLVVQMLFFPDHSASTVPAPHAPWSADHLEALATNGEADVWPTPDELPLIHADVARYFQDVRMQFVDFPRGDTGAMVPSHLVISGSVGHTLGARMYAPVHR